MCPEQLFSHQEFEVSLIAPTFPTFLSLNESLYDCSTYYKHVIRTLASLMTSTLSYLKLYYNNIIVLTSHSSLIFCDPITTAFLSSKILPMPSLSLRILGSLSDPSILGSLRLVSMTLDRGLGGLRPCLFRALARTMMGDFPAKPVMA